MVFRPQCIGGLVSYLLTVATTPELGVILAAYSITAEAARCQNHFAAWRAMESAVRMAPPHLAYSHDSLCHHLLEKARAAVRASRQAAKAVAVNSRKSRARMAPATVIQRGLLAAWLVPTSTSAQSMTTTQSSVRLRQNRTSLVSVFICLSNTFLITAGLCVIGERDAALAL